jgi:glycosyltransferase involved in cell wall biosynthesis
VPASDNRRPLRVAQVAPLWASVPPEDYGGIELIVHWLTEELARRGHEMTLFAAGNSATGAKLEAILEHSMLELMARGEAFEYEPYANAHLVEAIQQGERFDIIHCHLGTAQIPLAALSAIPVLFTTHVGLGPDGRWVLDRYQGIPVAAISHSQVADVVDRRRNQVQVIHYGMDLSSFDLSTAPGKYLAFLGRMGPHKNPVGAINIAKAAGHPIVLAGKPQDQAEESYFERSVKPLIDGTTVRYIDSVNQSQKRAFLEEAAALIFPIQWEEPFGIVMIEAMACGTPVVALKRGSVAEVIDPGVTGFYADSIEELASLVPRALALDRTAIREHAERRFTLERMVDDYIRFYASVLEASGRRSGGS